MLRKKQVFDGVEITWAAPKHYKAREVPTKVAQPAIPTTSSTTEDTTLKHTNTQPPIHPFAHIAEAQYVPPTMRNFAAPADKAGREKEPAYHTAAPIQNPKVIEEVYERSMKASCITLSPAELLSILPEYRQKMCDSVTPK